MKRMESLRWWQRLACRLWCPGWESERPLADAAEEGPWIAAAILMTNRGDFERETRYVPGNLRNAYEIARWLALKLADATHPELGVRWAVRRPQSGEWTP